MAKILNKFMEYIGFGKDDVEYDEEPEDGDCSRGTEKIHGTPRFVNGKCCQPSRSQLRKDDRLSPCQL